jgi:thiamine-phosphate pyrophosphorylase
MDAKRCGLITVLVPALQYEWVAELTGLVKRFCPAALILKNPAKDVLAQAIAAARPLELAILVADDLVTACNAGAGGVYFSPQAAPITKARDALGSGAVIGAACGLSHHTAMENAEAGADFIAFDASSPAALVAAVKLSSWWDEVANVPVALDFGSSRPDRSVLSKARPDFLMIEETTRAGESLTFATEFGLQSQI